MRCEERYNTRLNCIKNPYIHSVCNMITGIDKTSNCPKKKFDIANFDTTISQFNGNSQNAKYGVYYPPRRKEICLDVVNNLFTGDTSNCLIDAFVSVAKKEGELLWEKYADKNKAMMAIRRSYADLSDIIKGKDLWINDKHTEKANAKIKDVFYLEGEKRKDGMTREEWWKKYRKVIWKGMLCGIQNEVKDKISKEGLCFFHDDFDEIPQSLRCFVEWTEKFCEERLTRIDEFKMKMGEENKPKSCTELGSCNAQNGESCKEACRSYKEWTDKKFKEYNQQLNKYNSDKKIGKYNDIDDAKSDSASQYLLKKCTNCSMEDIDKEAFDYPPGYGEICKCLIEPKKEETVLDDSEQSPFEEKEDQKKSRESVINSEGLTPKTPKIDGGEDGHRGVTDISDQKNNLLNVKVPTFLTALGGIILLVTLLYRVRYEHIRYSN